MSRLALLIALLPAVAVAQTSGPARVYPWAEGAGRGVSGGKGQEIVAVTNLDDSGPGSARACLQADNVQCVPVVSGYVDLESFVLIGENVTWHGCVGPDEGITFRFTSTSQLQAPIRTNALTRNSIIRCMRIKTGDWNLDIERFGVGAGLRSGLVLVGADGFIADHVSIQWSQDRGYLIGERTTSIADAITVQNTMVAEPLRPEAFAGYGGTAGAMHDTQWRNLFLVGAKRLPKVGGGRHAVANIVTGGFNYNCWQSETASLDTCSPYCSTTLSYQRSDFLYNRCIPNLDSPPPDPGDLTSWALSGNGNPLFDGAQDTALYLVGNDGPHIPLLGTGQDALVESALLNHTGGPLGKTLFDHPIADAVPVPLTTDLTELENTLPFTAGAWVWRDAAEDRVVQDFMGARTLTVIEHQLDTCGSQTEQPPWSSCDADGVDVNDAFPALVSCSTPPCINDADLDLMPDWYEDHYSAVDSSFDDAGANADLDEWTNIEEYLNDWNPPSDVVGQSRILPLCLSPRDASVYNSLPFSCPTRSYWDLGAYAEVRLRAVFSAGCSAGAVRIEERGDAGDGDQEIGQLTLASPAATLRGPGDRFVRGRVTALSGPGCSLEIFAEVKPHPVLSVGLAGVSF